MSTYGLRTPRPKLRQGAGRVSNIPIDRVIAKINRQRKLAVEDFGNLSEIINVIFFATGGTQRNLVTLNALIGICKGRFDYQKDQAVWFSASRETLIDALIGRSIKKSSQLKAVSRDITRLIENQERAGVTWIEYKKGHGYGDRKPTPSRFRLVIYEYALDAYERVRADPMRYKPTGPGSKWKNAALEVAGEIPRHPSDAPKPKGKPKIDKTRSEAFNKARAWLKALREAGVDDLRIARDFNNFHNEILSQFIIDGQENDQEMVEAA
jgi:hypothetical protein